MHLGRVGVMVWASWCVRRNLPSPHWLCAAKGSMLGSKATRTPTFFSMLEALLSLQVIMEEEYQAKGRGRPPFSACSRRCLAPT